MFHLFNKIYLEDEKFFITKHSFEVVSKVAMPHPLSRQMGQSFGEVLAFEEYLGKEFSGSADLFWKMLIEKDSKKTFVVYAETELFKELQIAYWKNIFPDAGPADVFRIYQHYCLDDYLKKHLRSDPGDAVFDYSGLESETLGLKEFSKLFVEAVPLPSLQEMDKRALSFEYLMADYFHNPSSRYAPAFLEKVETLAWKAWFNDMEIMKSEISNSFYDIHKLFPDLKLDINDISAVKNFLKKDIRIRWMTDPNFRYDNIPYVTAVYKKEIFTDLAAAMHLNWGVQLKNKTPEEKQELLVEDHILQIEHLFSANYFGILENNIKKGFGCIFVNDELRNKSNQIFPCYLYDAHRNGRTAELKGYRLA